MLNSCNDLLIFTPNADKSVVVLDNLNTRDFSAFYQSFDIDTAAYTN